MNKEIFNEHFKKTSYIYYLLLLGKISFLVVSLVLVDYFNIKDEAIKNDFLRIFIPIVGIIVMILSNKIYNRSISGIKANASLENKLFKYRTYKIMQWALIEGAGFLALTVFIFTKQYLYVIISLFLIGYFILLRPTKRQLRTDMKI
ncbi:hypothetical protein ACFLSS_00240 [Bacteroidota bacterium]